MRRLLVLGLNHQTAALDVRERLAFAAPDQVRDSLAALAAEFPGCEAAILSTCNRVELYVARELHGHPKPGDLIAFLAKQRGAPADSFRASLYEKNDRAAVEHLFSVACSLDSMVLGETQILGQVRQAYELARDAGTAGAMLNPLFQRALAVGKEVVADTSLTSGRASVASVAVGYARQIFDHFDDKSVLCVGAGKMGRLVLEGFADLKPRELVVVNRDAGRAAALAAEFGGKSAPLDELAARLASADIVISSTGATRPIITRDLFESLLRRRRYRPAFLIDLAVPRDVEPEVAELDNVYLRNLDDLQQLIAATQGRRSDAAIDARAIVVRHVEQFVAGQRQRQLGPIIEQLFARSHALASEELERTLAKLPGVGPAERVQLEELTRRIVNKLLHDPVSALRGQEAAHSQANAGSGGAVSTPYLHAMEKLFRLDAAPEEEAAVIPKDDAAAGDSGDRASSAPARGRAGSSSDDAGVPGDATLAPAEPEPHE